MVSNTYERPTVCLGLDLRLQIVDLIGHSKKPSEVGTAIIPILQVEKLRPGEAK